MCGAGGKDLVDRLAYIARWLCDDGAADVWRLAGSEHFPQRLGRGPFERDIVSKRMKERTREEWPELGYPMPDLRVLEETASEILKHRFDPDWRLPHPPGYDENIAAIYARLDALLSPCEQRIEDASRARRDAEEAERQAAKAARKEILLNRPAPSPAPLPYGVSPRGAELLAADWMRHIGILDAQVTPAKADGGVDVVSDTHVAQVKHYKGNVSVLEVRELFGVSAARGKQALFFTSAGYTADAITFAEATGLALFVYNAELGTLRGVNEPARQMA